MTTKPREKTTAGVYVEFRDAAGHTIGQALYPDWQGRPVPAVGDLLTCDALSTGGQNAPKLVGRVASRRFDVQQTVDGTPCVWVQLIVAAKSGVAQESGRRGEIGFSRN
jgi:hypothetical protein